MNPKMKKRPTFTFDDSKPDWPRAIITYPNGQTQLVHRDLGARLDQPAFIARDDKDLRIYLCSQSHREARKLGLTDEEWDYEAGPGEVAGFIY